METPLEKMTAMNIFQSLVIRLKNTFGGTFDHSSMQNFLVFTSSKTSPNQWPSAIFDSLWDASPCMHLILLPNRLMACHNSNEIWQTQDIWFSLLCLVRAVFILLFQTISWYGRSIDFSPLYLVMQPRLLGPVCPNPSVLWIPFVFWLSAVLCSSPCFPLCLCTLSWVLMSTPWLIMSTRVRLRSLLFAHQLQRQSPLGN